jgi:chitin disaccharide deacetylase
VTDLPSPSRPSRRLIVNADDFGQTSGINEAVIRCHETGIVTSASLMVRWPLAAAAAEYARRHPALSVGLHIDLGEWLGRDGRWVAVYEVVPIQNAAAIRYELARQLESFRRLMRRDPTHLDSHQHVHRGEPVRSVVREMGERLGVACRGLTGSIGYCGEFYGQTKHGDPLERAISVESLIGILRALPEGTTELACHPGLRGDAPGLYVAERELEARVLCDRRSRQAIDEEGIELISFSALDQHVSH